MVKNKKGYPDKKLYDFVLSELTKRGITAENIGKTAFEAQKKYYPDNTPEFYAKEFNKVLQKREVLNNIAVALSLDILAEKHLLPEPVQEIIENDKELFGVDEELAICISNLYGSLAVTNYSYLDKSKSGKVAELDEDTEHINTFADDIYSAIVSAVIGRTAHGRKLDLGE